MSGRNVVAMWLWLIQATVALWYHEWSFVALGIIMSRLSAMPAVVVIETRDR